MNGQLCLAVDASPDRSSSAVGVAWRRQDGRLVVEVADQRQGLDWLVGRVVELVGKHRPLATVVDRGGPAGTVCGPLEAADVELLVPSAQEVAQSAEAFFDAVIEGRLAHQGDYRLDAAVAGCAKRPIGEAWGWARRTSKADISPLVAASLALWGFVKLEGEAGEPGIYF